MSLILKYNQLHPDIVKGVDLSGDPNYGTFADFKDTLNAVRKSGLGLALHCGEIDNQMEISEMLEFGMNRLGHGTFITGI